MTLVIFAVVIGALMFASYWLAAFVGPKVGVKVRDANPAKQRVVWLMLLYLWAVAVAVVWAFNSGHKVVGVAILIASYALPDIVLRTLRINRSRSRHEPHE